MVPGKGQMTHHRQAGRCDARSIQAAESMCSRGAYFGITPPVFNQSDIHVHVPEGATPKDGPSAGVGMSTSIVSRLTGIPVRADVAMTGEDHAAWRVLAIGGLKEKLLGGAARRHQDGADPTRKRKRPRDIPDVVKDRTWRSSLCRLLTKSWSAHLQAP